jgi:hypothetical protein
MKITADLLEGEDISLKERKRLILVSSSVSLEDILHLVTVYFNSPSINFDKGIIRINLARGTYDHEQDSLVLFNCMYQVASSQTTIILIGDDSEKLGEFSNNLLKLKGMKELN